MADSPNLTGRLKRLKDQPGAPSPWTVRNMNRGLVRHWVGASGSLSARLAGVGGFYSVKVLNQGLQKLRWDEAHALGLPAGASGRPGYVREVLLCIAGVAVVFARSVTAHAPSLGPWRSVRGLGTRPLADVLFNRIGMARTPMAFAKLKPVSVAHRHVARAWQLGTGTGLAVRTLPARRSVFIHQGAPLLVMEVFAGEAAPWVSR